MSYCTIDQVKTALGEDVLDGGELDASVYQFNADVAQELIDEYCERSWAVITGARSFDAPDGPVLVIDDATAITAITAYGGAPLGTSLYRAVYDEPGGPIVRVERLGATGDLVSWQAGQPGSPFGQIVVTGTFAAQTTPPLRVVLANIVIAVKLVKLHLLQYTRSGGNPMAGESGADDELFPRYVRRMLDPLSRRPVAVIRGTPLTMVGG